MAITRNRIIDNFDTGDLFTDTYRAPRGGVLVLDAVWTADTVVLTLEISVDSGTTFVAMTDATGNAISATLASVSPHWHVEILSQVDAYYKVTADTNGDVDLMMSRVITE